MVAACSQDHFSHVNMLKLVQYNLVLPVIYFLDLIHLETWGLYSVSDDTN